MRSTDTAPAVRVDGNRLWQTLMAMGEIGATPKGGCKRIALSAEDCQGRELFRRWCEQAALTVATDRAGNLFARRPGRSELAPVVVGSHLDTQPTGGKFDGVYGVLAGLEVLRTLRDSGIETERPIEIACWTNEEGAVFRSMMGSAIFTGRMSLAEACALEDAAGRTFGQALEAAHVIGELAPDLAHHPMHCYLEAHIEQGPVLEAEGVQIGVVTGGVAFRRYLLTLIGQEAHAGPTPMNLRRDAMLGAASAVLAGVAMARGMPAARATFGWLQAYPGSPNTIPGRVEMTVDLRHPADEPLDRLERDFAAAVRQICSDNGLTHAFDRTVTSPAIEFHAELVDACEESARRLGFSHRRLASGAGHDACNLAHEVPTTMVFIPCEGGISHNEEENAREQDCEAGCNVLLDLVLKTASMTRGESLL